ncbi:MAG TPA: MBL fold metallo-hydrolase, partial [Rhizomicrobium sp.]
MSVTLFAFTCGTVTGASNGFLAGEPGKLSVPVPAYLIEHPQGRVLFDTGLNLAIRQEKNRLLGPTAGDWEIDFPEGADIASQLARLGLRPADIRYVVNSHLHYDHCGGNGFFPDATLVIHAKEWRAAH